MKQDTESCSIAHLHIDTATGKRCFQLNGFEQDWGYAQAVRVGDTVYVSGTVSVASDGTPLVIGDMAGQVQNVYADVGASLAAHGATIGHVVREAIVTTDLERFMVEGMPVRKAAYAGYALPASAPWIEVPRLAHRDFLFEVEVMAVVPSLPASHAPP